jgi:putative restriction endonuclease
MPVSFEKIQVGSLWQRETLADLWGYETYHAIARGVVTPSGMNLIILFVEEAMPGRAAPYSNRLTGRTLHWEGEKAHGSDQRIVRAATVGDQIHVFHRLGHRSPFTYQGRARLLSFEELVDLPSRAEFELPDKDLPSGEEWTAPELGVAMNIYCSLPEESFNSTDPLVLEVARLLSRPPEAMVSKLTDLASLNPVRYTFEPKGLGSKVQEGDDIWKAFTDNWASRSFDSEARLADLRGKSVDDLALSTDPEPLPREGVERAKTVLQRVHQGFFRKTVLASYGNRCCITGLAVPELLVAGHIVRWADDYDNRVNPANGLCLNALHDRAFECGLITLSETNTVLVSSTLRSRSKKTCTALEETLLRYHDVPIQLPTRFEPSQEFLAQHREKRFRR